jgi:hypothetical protein
MIPLISEQIRAWRAAWRVIGDTIPPRDPNEDRPDEPAVIREPDEDE